MAGQPISSSPSADGIPYNNLTFAWDIHAIPAGTNYFVRLVCNQDSATVATVAGVFSIGVVRSYYVNDGSTANDVYCTAAGSDANDALSPATPKASVNAVLDSYDLEPGDTVLVDTGVYTLTNNLTIAGDDNGSSAGYVNHSGQHRLERDGVAADEQHHGSAVVWLDDPADYIRLKNLRLTGGWYGLYVSSHTRKLSSGGLRDLQQQRLRNQFTG